MKATGSSADRQMIESIIGFVRDLYVRLGSGGFYLLLLLFLAGVLWVSYAVSVWVFRRREF